jgi:hypothetical protein
MISTFFSPTAIDDFLPSILKQFVCQLAAGEGFGFAAIILKLNKISESHARAFDFQVEAAVA